MRERRGQVIEARPFGPSVTLITVGCVEPPAIIARPGQFVSVRAPGGERRSYSIVSAGGESSRFEIALRSGSPDGTTSALVASLVAGAAVEYFGPMGYFLFEPAPTSEFLFGATGVGITALLPMIAEALASSAGQIELFWGLRDAADNAFGDRLDELAKDPRFSYRVLYSGAGDGHITEPLAARANAANNPQLYLCGHGAMIADVTGRLRPDFSRDRIHTEVFYPVVSAP